jgi:formylmethanofuran dehydrogenase subunit B
MTEAAIDGRPSPLDDAIGRAAEILRAARRPLFKIGGYTTLESQRAAVLLAQQLGGVIDSACIISPSLFPEIGSVTCSLGEMKNRSDLVVLWRCNASETHPAFLDEVLNAPGRFRNGRRDRTLVVVGDEQTATDLQADSLKCGAQSSFAAIWLLRAIVQNKYIADDPVGGTPVREWRKFVAFVKSHRFAVFVLDGLPDSRVIEAAHGLAMDLQACMRCYVIVLHGSPNPLGLQSVVTSLGFRPSGTSKECDAILSLGQKSLSMDNSSLARIPQIHISALIPDATQTSTVWINTAACGKAEVGNAIRFDGACVAWRAVSPASVPNDFAVLNRIANQLRPA